jgi:Rrf2 family iron-sulfur cluster assembly transcriptional regulator
MRGMFRYGKLARQAVSAMSYLAERHGPDAAAISSAEVGRARGIPGALAAKLLSEAAAAGLVRGVTGPGGGYRLARRPEEICLGEIVGMFERPGEGSPCPFGPGWCGHGNPCPLHDDFHRLEEDGLRFLRETTLAVFQHGMQSDTAAAQAHVSDCGGKR